MRLEPPPLALYLHFPWCVRKCPYCDFNSHTLHGELPEREYAAALRRDVEAQAPGVAGRDVQCVFLGGGTPSLFSPETIGSILEHARSCLAFKQDAEITMEANPGAVERSRFADYRAAGINRVSLGAQSFDTRQLSTLGRIHSPEETRRAAGELHAAGIGNFNLDLMYALPRQTVDEALADVEAAIALEPSHVSHYQLTIEPGTVFAAAAPPLPDDDAADEMLDGCQRRLAAAGFARYEVSAYARPGRRSEHNLNYWRFGDYLGAGAGAHGKLTDAATGAIKRTVRLREPRRYVAADPQALARSVVPAAELPFEFMLNALRLVDGFEPELFQSRTGLAWRAVEPQMADLRSEGLVERAGGSWRASERGLRFLNDVLVRFIPEGKRPEGGFP